MCAKHLEQCLAHNTWGSAKYLADILVYPCKSGQLYLLKILLSHLISISLTLSSLLPFKDDTVYPFFLHVVLVQSLSHVWLFATPWTAHARLPCPSPSLRACSNSCPLSQRYHPTVSSSVVPFSSCPQSFPASGSFPMSQFFASGSQSIGASASASVLLMNIWDWFPLGLTSLISLQSEGLSSVLSNTTVQTHQFFSAQPSSWSNSHTHT